METYTTLRGELLDLFYLSGQERAFFDRCLKAYQGEVDWFTLGNLINSIENPVLRLTGGLITRAIIETPLYRALQDLEDRAGIRQGELEPEPGDDLQSDPMGDEWISTTNAALRKGVARSGLHAAIERGDVLARPLQPGGTRRLVSLRSLERWQPMPGRQKAGRARQQIKA